ncbi:MAG TPA: four helix bundle protein [Thermomicrobiales bacterium]
MAWERNYHKLTLWHRAMEFADLVYDATERWPSHEQFGMTSQVRRAAVSVPANVAEGQGRFGNKEFLHHLSIAYGSLNETETLLQFGRRRGYVDEPSLDRLMNQSGEVGRLMISLMHSLRKSISA